MAIVVKNFENINIKVIRFGIIFLDFSIKIAKISVTGFLQKVFCKDYAEFCNCLCLPDISLLKTYF